MDSTTLKFFSNPIMIRIILIFDNGKKLSAKDVKKALPDVPQATLYRYIKKLYDNNVLKLEAENKIRGTIERKYSLNINLSDYQSQIEEPITTQHYFNLFSEFVFGLLSEFKDYTEDDCADVVNDGTGFSSAPIFATPDELKVYSEQIAEILTPALSRRHENQCCYNFVNIITPPHKNKEKENKK